MRGLIPYILALLALSTLACSTVRIGGTAPLASLQAGECVTVGTCRVQYGFWGTVTSDECAGFDAPEGKRLRVVAKRHGLDGFLSYLGAALTGGLYAGSVQYSLEACD